jgi:hypothetical protein
MTEPRLAEVILDPTVLTGQAIDRAVGNAKDVLGARIEAAEKTLDVLFSDSTKVLQSQVAGLKELIASQRLDDRAMLDDRAREQKHAIELALAGLDRAVSKAEVAVDKRFDSVNEFRQTLSDQARDFASNQAVDIRFGTAFEKLAGLDSSVRAIQAKESGFNAAWVVVFSLIVAGSAVAALVLTLVVRH